MDIEKTGEDETTDYYTVTLTPEQYAQLEKYAAAIEQVKQQMRDTADRLGAEGHQAQADIINAQLGEIEAVTEIDDLHLLIEARKSGLL